MLPALLVHQSAHNHHLFTQNLPVQTKTRLQCLINFLAVVRKSYPDSTKACLRRRVGFRDRWSTSAPSAVYLQGNEVRKGQLDGGLWICTRVRRAGACKPTHHDIRRALSITPFSVGQQFQSCRTTAILDGHQKDDPWPPSRPTLIDRWESVDRKGSQ